MNWPLLLAELWSPCNEKLHIFWCYIAINHEQWTLGESVAERFVSQFSEALSCMTQQVWAEAPSYTDYQVQYSELLDRQSLWGCFCWMITSDYSLIICSTECYDFCSAPGGIFCWKQTWLWRKGKISATVEGKLVQHGPWIVKKMADVRGLHHGGFEGIVQGKHQDQTETWVCDHVKHELCTSAWIFVCEQRDDIIKYGVWVVLQLQAQGRFHDWQLIVGGLTVIRVFSGGNSNFAEILFLFCWK